MERARHAPARVHRQRHEVGERRERVGRGWRGSLVGAALDGHGVGETCGVGDEGIDRALDDLRVGLRWRRLSRLRRLEIERAAVHLAAERQTGGPCRRLQQEREHLLLGDGALRHLDDDLVVAMEHDRPAAGLEADDGGREQIACGALHDVLDQQPEPRASALPLASRVVEEFDVGIAVLELGVRHQARLRIVDRATARQRQGERVVGEGGDDRRPWGGRYQDRLPGADGDARGSRQLVPRAGARPGVRRAIDG